MLPSFSLLQAGPAAAQKGLRGPFCSATTALRYGGRSDGEPGIRPEYGANYFGAFVFDPDGNKIEAVTHSAE
jgi:hypothetical protein